MSIIDSEYHGVTWRKASRSVGNGECVEISSHLGRVSIRDSKNPEGPVLSYPAKAFPSLSRHREETRFRAPGRSERLLNANAPRMCGIPNVAGQ